MRAYIIYERFYDHNGDRLLVGGIESYLLALANLLKKKDIQPIIIQYAKNNFKIEHNNILIYGYSVKKNKNLYKQLYDKVERSISHDDIIIWGLDRGAQKIRHLRTISIQHGIPFDYYQEERRSHKIIKKLHLIHVLKWYQRRKAIKSFKRATYKVCVDYNFWNWFRTFCSPEEEKNIYVIPNFTKCCEFRNFPKVQDSFKIVFARRFVRMRGIEVFMNVANYFKNDPRLTFTFAGDGPYLSEIKELQSKSHNINITQYSPEDAVEFHKRFDIAIIPSLASEGTSLSLLEAMSAGDAVICTCVGGMTNVILDNYNGMFVRPNNPQDIIEAIEKLIQCDKLRIELAHNAQVTVQAAFSLTIWEKRWGVILDKIINI